ncbi:2'-5' RNA ligase family protein [Adhaeribacter swui]|uniref:2'-5' RNA ligase family protein n=1 Tax=Adhaeribacter swui TaxID=2086471 RepID=A0A7G7GBR6_9BACT|nr:2'-5' RNA ligase family protein [Adhaeribacter swui]QNF34600.1 2'-5' RNA ligase family protein [Adhaeribacter swui]
MNNQPPRILTLQLEESGFSYFNDLRKKHFPAQINYLDAHVTLFHHLPAESEILQVLETLTSQQPHITLQVTSIFKLGRGIAFKLESKALMQIQAQLKQQWYNWLTPQDRQGFRPHVTVQNKVTPAEAQALYDKLIATFNSFTVQGVGLSLWEYLGGPWQKIKDYPFSSTL